MKLIRRSAAPIATFAIFFVFTGCLSHLEPLTQTFAFSANHAGSNSNASSYVLGIHALGVASPFDGREFVYRTGATTFSRDPYAEFLDPPAEEIVSPVREWFLGRGNFSTVTEPGGVTRPNVFAEFSVTELYGDYRKPGRPAAVFTMRFVFVDAPGGIPGRIIFEGEYSRNEPLKERSPSALMDAWNRELADILADVNRELSGNILTRAHESLPK